jgi:hypothetical protein
LFLIGLEILDKIKLMRDLSYIMAQYVLGQESIYYDSILKKYVLEHKNKDDEKFENVDDLLTAIGKILQKIKIDATYSFKYKEENHDVV